MSNNNEISETMYLALDHQFNSELLNAKSSVLVYFNNAVGIGEHPQRIQIVVGKLIDTMASAQDKLDILHKHFSKYKKIINESDIRRASP
tara:strand:- start:183 stop:452 length:270 start_codon:yes stop_codon:yes gene_type:complete